MKYIYIYIEIQNIDIFIFVNVILVWIINDIILKKGDLIILLLFSFISNLFLN